MYERAPYSILLYRNTKKMRIWNSIYYTCTYTYIYVNIFFLLQIHPLFPLSINLNTNKIKSDRYVAS